MIRPVYCIGGANIDSKLKSPANLTLGTSNPVSSSSAYGGVARNVAQNLAHWTSNIHLQCVVGDDDLGLQMLDHIRQLGVNTEHCVVLADKKTSQYYAILNNDGELFVALADMEIYDHLLPSEMVPAWDYWQEQGLIFLDTNLPAELISRALKTAEVQNLPVCIDTVSVNKVQKLPSRLGQVFLLKADQLEASALSRIAIRTIEDCFTAGRKIQERGVENVVISLGKLGYVVITKMFAGYVRTPEVENIVDISGAGDAFIAGILLGLQHHEPLLKACQLGAAAASYTIQSLQTVAQNVTVAQLYACINNYNANYETICQSAFF